jgi:hypothetical protein
MKNIGLSFFYLIGVCVAGFAQNVPFQRLGYAFTQTNVNLIWNAPTNNLPKALWNYRALPSEISPAVISNLVTLGAFTDKDKRVFPDNIHTISYTDPTGKRSLLVNTDWVFINYGDAEANDMHITEGVPNKQQALDIATNWLPKLGIDRDQLARKSPSGDLLIFGGEATTFLYKNWSGPAYATNVSTYQVTFKRSLDGVQISGGSARGGYGIGIGHHGKISRILVSWRKYERDKLYPTATPERFLKWIQEGKAVWYSDDLSFIDWPSVKRIIVRKVTPYYYSEGYGENDKPQNAAFPFAEMEAVADTGTTNLTFYLDCPIAAEP